MAMLRPGDTIGIISPSHVAEREHYAPIFQSIESMGLCAKAGANLYKSTYGYLASELERAEDFNQMAADPDVRMILFGGGEGANELLPYIDFDCIRRNPKPILSYSDGTFLLDAIYAKTGMVTYYGQGAGMLVDMQPYDRQQFLTHFMQDGVTDFVPNSEWHALHEGVGQGVLIGGYLDNLALMLGGEYFQVDEGRKYILFLEDHEQFNSIAHVSGRLSHIEQSALASRISGLLFGHYSETVFPDLRARLARFGEKHQVPVACCDDFGHGMNHAILPIGREAVLDTKRCTLRFA
ncbi:MAG: LD-carboxypeptidase [Clostridia bacterium]